MRRRPDIPSLVAGVALIGFGVTLVLRGADVGDIDFAVLAPVACAVVGAILLSLGLARDR